jgi:putative transposase
LPVSTDRRVIAGQPLQWLSHFLVRTRPKQMKRSRHSEEKILFALKQAEAGQPVGDVCRQMGISEATFYVWKKRYANLGTLEMRELRQLRDENAKLKRLVADLTLDRHVLQEVIKKRSSCDEAQGARSLGA